MRFRVKKGQGATEYAIFIAAVLAGLIAMQVYYQRSVKGNMRSRADSIGEQYDNTGTYNSTSASFSHRTANTNNADTAGGWTKSDVVDDAEKGIGGLKGALKDAFGSTVLSPANAGTSGEGSVSTSNDSLGSFNNVAGKTVWDDGK